MPQTGLQHCGDGFMGNATTLPAMMSTGPLAQRIILRSVSTPLGEVAALPDVKMRPIPRLFANSTQSTGLADPSTARYSVMSIPRAA